MSYELSKAPEGYDWELKQWDGDPGFGKTDGKTYEIYLSKDGRQVERRGVFVPTNRASETKAFIKAMEESIRMAL
jgi:hypothetical protein